MLGNRVDLMVKCMKGIFPDREEGDIRVLRIGHLGQMPSVVFSRDKFPVQ